MKKLVLLSAAVLLSVNTLSFADSLHSLNKAQVSKVLEGNTFSTVPLATLQGKLINDTFTGFLGKDGKAQAQFATKPANAPQSDTGTWMVKEDGTLCVHWQHWDSAKPVCVSIYNLANGYLFVNQGNKKLESFALKTNFKSGNKIH